LSSPKFKIVESTLDGPREELRLAILEVEAAEVDASKAQAEADQASARLRLAKSAHGVAVDALDAARAGQIPLSDRLAAANSDDERWAIVEAHNAAGGRPATITADALKRMRQEIEAADDAVILARNALEIAEARARPALSALSRAKDRRARAVQEVVRPEVPRLQRECQDLVERLSAARAALNYAANSLIDPMSDERRQAFYFFGRAPLFPEESGLVSDNDLTKRNEALAAWSRFADAIAQNAQAPFPSS
jgi:hypothetical protein